jgi:hypothetical protein
LTTTPESTIPWPSATNQLLAASEATDVMTSPDCAYTVPFDEAVITQFIAVVVDETRVCLTLNHADCAEVTEKLLI